MRYSKKPNKFEKMAQHRLRVERALKGEGLYVYENNTKGDYTLPKPTQSGLKTVAPGQQFQGDNYFMRLVKNNELKLIREVVSPDTERKNNMKDEKLILDQPDKITNFGKVEHVVANPPQQLDENQEEEKEILINEDPMDGVEIITD